MERPTSALRHNAKCPILDDDGTACSGAASIMVVVGQVFGVESFLNVCLWHAEVIEPSEPYPAPSGRSLYSRGTV